MPYAYGNREDEMNRIWKVVTKDRKSAVMSGGCPACVLDYPKHGIVMAPADTLGVFGYSTRAAARNFRKPAIGERVIQLETLTPVQRVTIIVCATLYKGGMPSAYRSSLRTPALPDTVMCMKVRVLT